MSGRMPETRYEMRRANYELKGTTACKSCGEPIEWWKTTNGKMMPFNGPKDANNEMEIAVTHWATCKHAKEHRKAKAAAAPKQPAGELTEPATIAVLERELAWFGRRHGCNAITAVRDDGNAFVVRAGQDPEQIRMDLITLANAAKRQLEGMNS